MTMPRAERRMLEEAAAVLFKEGYTVAEVGRVLNLAPCEVEDKLRSALWRRQ